MKGEVMLEAMARYIAWICSDRRNFGRALLCRL